MKKTQPSLVVAASLFLALPASALSSAAAQEEAEPSSTAQPQVHDGGLESIQADHIQAHVNYLASDELMGRYAKSKQGKLATEYLAERYAEYGLEPFGDADSFFQEVPGFSPNVVGVLRGSSDQYVILSAHYDHLEPRTKGEDRIYNGADDNASGSAAVLELAQAFGSQKKRFNASIVFIGFTAEEGGLRGSKFFVGNAPMKLSRIRGVFNMDMISRGKKNLIFCEGGKQAPQLLQAIKNANKKIKLEVRYGKHPEWIKQSDQYPFIQKDVHALYFGVEDHKDYHQVSDHADKILPGLAAKVARLIYLAAIEVSSAD